MFTEQFKKEQVTWHDNEEQLIQPIQGVLGHTQR